MTGFLALTALVVVSNSGFERSASYCAVAMPATPKNIDSAKPATKTVPSADVATEGVNPSNNGGLTIRKAIRLPESSNLTKAISTPCCQTRTKCPSGCMAISGKNGALADVSAMRSTKSIGLPCASNLRKKAPCTSPWPSPTHAMVMLPVVRSIPTTLSLWDPVIVVLTRNSSADLAVPSASYILAYTLAAVPS